jgi:hypothetical protein
VHNRYIVERKAHDEENEEPNKVPKTSNTQLLQLDYPKAPNMVTKHGNDRAHCQHQGLSKAVTSTVRGFISDKPVGEYYYKNMIEPLGTFDKECYLGRDWAIVEWPKTNYYLGPNIRAKTFEKGKGSVLLGEDLAEIGPKMVNQWLTSTKSCSITITNHKPGGLDVVEEMLYGEKRSLSNGVWGCDQAGKYDSLILIVSLFCCRD